MPQKKTPSFSTLKRLAEICREKAFRLQEFADLLEEFEDMGLKVERSDIQAALAAYLAEGGQQPRIAGPAQHGIRQPRRSRAGSSGRSPRPYLMLEKERQEAVRLARQGLGVREIARQLKRSPSTISRLLKAARGAAQQNA
ncbi:MAG: helix-turn-helix domain-containing protein [Candidatus Levybacteria bacterium]|nr:helix-turn-helix domain-containing protein [Candidatus Levybacteria bacterium]